LKAFQPGPDVRRASGGGLATGRDFACGSASLTTGWLASAAADSRAPSGTLEKRALGREFARLAKLAQLLCNASHSKDTNKNFLPQIPQNPQNP
jgi:hypothetical protein